MHHHAVEPRRDESQPVLPPIPCSTDGPACRSPSKPTQDKSQSNFAPRKLPAPAPVRIHFGSRLVLYKKTQTADTILYITHIKGKPTFIFVMDKFDPATSIAWKGAFRERAGVILADRDGVIKDSRFLNETDKEKAAEVMLPSALLAAKRAHETNIGLGIVTNQGGYQSGQMTFEDTIAINVRIIQQIANAGGHIDAVFICPFAKALEGQSPGIFDARKPGPGMFLYAAQLAALNGVRVLASAGDQRTDGAAAQAAGQKFYAITGPSGRWRDELISARKRGEVLPQLNLDPRAYEEVTEFADVVNAFVEQLDKQ